MISMRILVGLLVLGVLSELDSGPLFTFSNILLSFALALVIDIAISSFIFAYLTPQFFLIFPTNTSSREKKVPLWLQFRKQYSYGVMTCDDDCVARLL